MPCTVLNKQARDANLFFDTKNDVGQQLGPHRCRSLYQYNVARAAFCDAGIVGTKRIQYSSRLRTGRSHEGR